MDYDKNLQNIRDLCEYGEDGVFWMNSSKTKGYSIKLKDIPEVKCCIACKHFAGKCGIGYGGKWIFKSLEIYFLLKDLRQKCTIDEKYHTISSEDVSGNEMNCKYFESILPTSYDNLPNAVNDITL